jgi:hypothetical protein
MRFSLNCTYNAQSKTNGQTYREQFREKYQETAVCYIFISLFMHCLFYDAISSLNYMLSYKRILYTHNLINFLGHDIGGKCNYGLLSTKIH